MSLTKYKKKRNFRTTAEPEGHTTVRKRGALRFVIQKHAASHLHYDFRLEVDGVMKSWAVPKGPSLDPSVKRLAMMVEDHPLEYRTFEGTIPKGNYGAGKVIVWDEGTYHVPDTGDSRADERAMREGLQKGTLRIVLEGKKLRGGFTMARIGGDGRRWLLMKRKDEFAGTGDILARKESVRSDATLGEGIGSAPEGEMPHDVKPMLARLTKTPLNGPDWLFEIKWDGYRAIAEINDGKVSLYSRKGNSFNERYSPVVRSLQTIPGSAVLDGEVVAVDAEGRSSFQLLQNYQRTGHGELIYYVFDILYLNGRDVRALSLIERKELLHELLPDLQNVRYSDHVLADGRAFLKEAKQRKLEGIIAKQVRSPYRVGERTDEWMKIKTSMRQEAVIGGFTEARGSRKHFGALVLGVYDGDEFVYVGHTGGGFNVESLKEVKEKMFPLIRPTSPFTPPPKTNAPVTWVAPELVCEVAFSEWTEDGIFRQPIFVGLREDKSPREVVREGFEGEGGATTARRKKRSAAAASNGDPKLTHLDKIYWPDEKYTKGDLIAYYRSVARTMLPYLKNRPHSLHRHPNGIAGGSFFQKDVGDTAPAWIKTVEVESESKKETIRYLVCTDEASLLYMVNLGCIEINPWFSRVESIENPDYLVIDLDPEGVGFDAVVETALVTKRVLDRAGAVAICKTSGATGLHIYVPLHAKYDYEVAKNFAHLIVRLVNEELPDLTSLERSPGKRKKKVYLDYLQNRTGQTLAAPYSVRPRPGAPVATPLEWNEVKKGLDPAAFTIRTIQRRLKAKGDLLKGVLGRGVSIERCMAKLGAGDR